MTVAVEADQLQLRVEITDDGVGFDSARAREFLQMGRVGLASMRERVELASGTFVVRSTPGRGTTIVATLPIDGPAGGPSSSASPTQPDRRRRGRPPARWDPWDPCRWARSGRWDPCGSWRSAGRWAGPVRAGGAGRARRSASAWDSGRRDTGVAGPDRCGPRTTAAGTTRRACPLHRDRHEVVPDRGRDRAAEDRADALHACPSGSRPGGSPPTRRWPAAACSRRTRRRRSPARCRSCRPPGDPRAGPPCRSRT